MTSLTPPPEEGPPAEPLSQTPSPIKDNLTSRPPQPLAANRFITNAEPRSLSPTPALGSPTAHELDTAAQPLSPRSGQAFLGDTRPTEASCENLGPAPAAAATRTETPRSSDGPIPPSSSTDISKRIPPQGPRRIRRSERPGRVPIREPAPTLVTQAGSSQGAAGRPSFSEVGLRSQRFFSGQQFRWPSPVPGKPSRSSVPATTFPAVVSAEPAGSHPETSRRASVVETPRRESILAPQPRAIYHNHAPRLERMSMEESLDDSVSDHIGSPGQSSASLSDTPTLPCSLGSPAPVKIPRRTKSDPGHRSESATPSPVRPLSDILPLKRSMYDGSVIPSGPGIEILSFGSCGSPRGVTTPCPVTSAGSVQPSGHSSPSRSQQTQTVWPRCPLLSESEMHAPKAEPRFFPPMSPGTWKATVGSRRKRQGKRRSGIQALLTFPREEESPGDVPQEPVIELPRWSLARERQELDENSRVGLSGEARREVPEPPPPELAQSVESLALDLEGKPRVKLPKAQDSLPPFAEEDRGSYGESLVCVAEEDAEALPGQKSQQQPPGSMAWEEGRAGGYVPSTFEFRPYADAEQHVEADNHTNQEQHTQSELNMEWDDHQVPWQSMEPEPNVERQHPGSQDGQTVDSDIEPDVWYTPRGISEVPTERQLGLGKDQSAGIQAEGRGQDTTTRSSSMITGQHTPSENSTTPEPRSPSKPRISPKHRVASGSHSLPEQLTPPGKVTPSKKVTPPRKATPLEQEESPSTGLSAKARGKLRSGKVPVQLPEQGGPSSLRQPSTSESRRSDIN